MDAATRERVDALYEKLTASYDSQLLRHLIVAPVRQLDDTQWRMRDLMLGMLSRALVGDYPGMNASLDKGSECMTITAPVMILGGVHQVSKLAESTPRYHDQVSDHDVFTHLASCLHREFNLLRRNLHAANLTPLSGAA